MEELLKRLVTPLVDHPEDIVIDLEEDSTGILMRLHVNPEDIGSVIGRGGRRATAIRSIMKAKGNVVGERIRVDIADPEMDEE